jgi:hypothetical protein
MKAKTITILSVILFTYSIIGIAAEVIYTWNKYYELLDIGGQRVATYYISSAVWRELYFNLVTPIFANSLAFFLMRDRFSDNKRRLIKYGFYASSIWMLSAFTLILIVWIFKVNI